MVYPRVPVINGPDHNPAPTSPTPASPKSTKKKRKKLQKSNLKPGASARKVLQQAAQEKGSRADYDDDDDDVAAAAASKEDEVGAVNPSTPTRRRRLSLSLHIDIPRARGLVLDPAIPTPNSLKGLTPSETFVFNSLKQYRIARALFSNGYSSAGSPRVEDANIKANLRWNQVMTLLTSAPISCVTNPMKGVSVKIFRPARNGVEGRRMVLHKPHGKNPRCEREVLENFASAMKLAFGWEKAGFMVAVGAAAGGQSADTADADEDEDDVDEVAPAGDVDIDSI